MKTKAEVMRDLAKVRRRKITVQKKIDGYDEYDNPIEIWSNWKALWVERSSLWGQEYYAAAAIGQEETVTFTLKYVSFLDDLNAVEYRILYEGKAYDLKGVDLLKDDGQWIKIRAIERPGGAGGMDLLDHQLVKDLVTLLWDVLTDPEIAINEEIREEYETRINSVLEGWV